MKQFIFPELGVGSQFCGVYKMIFDCGSYYIGSALNLKQRMWGWKFKLNSGVLKNYKITDAFNKTDSVKFEVLEIVDDPIMRRYREDGYIKIHYGKPGCLNIADNAFNNTGIKQNPNRKRHKQRGTRVAKINDIGEVLETYESITEANLANNTRKINDCFNDSLKKIHGFMFRKLDGDGNIIPAKIKERGKRKARKRGYKVSEKARKNMIEARRRVAESGCAKLPAHTKQVVKYTIDGIEVCRFRSVGEASRSLGHKDTSNLRRLMNGKEKGRKGYHKGFFYKYA